MVTTPPTTPTPLPTPPADCQWGRYNVNYIEADGETASVGHLRPPTPLIDPSGSVLLSPPPLQAPQAEDERDVEVMRLKRHSSDVTASRTTRANQSPGVGANNSSRLTASSASSKLRSNSNRITRRKSEVASSPIAAVARNQLQQQNKQQHLKASVGATLSLPPTTTTTSCLRHQDNNGTAICSSPVGTNVILLNKNRPSTHCKRVAFSDAPSVIWTDRSSPTAAVVILNSGQHQVISAPGSSRFTSASKKCLVDLVGLEGGGTTSTDASASGANNSPSPSSSSVVVAESEVLTPKERRRRKVVMAVVCTTFILLTASALFVLITLFNASAIDEAGSLTLIFSYCLLFNAQAQSSRYQETSRKLKTFIDVSLFCHLNRQNRFFSSRGEIGIIHQILILAAPRERLSGLLSFPPRSS